MATIDNNTPVRKYLPRSPRVDMTPMVDLGFLLIAFFIFTTQVKEDKALKYNTPVPDISNPVLVKCTRTVTLMPGGDGMVKWIDYVDGIEQPPYLLSLYSGQEVRQRLLTKRDQMKRFFGDPHELFVIIKPDSSCSYETFIDLVDEMMITDVTRYAVTDL